MARSFAFPNYESGVNPATLTGVAQASLDGFSRLEYKIKEFGNALEPTKDYFIVGYWDVGTFTQATYNSFPIGSIVWDFVGFTLNIKTGLTTWKAVALT